LLSADNFSFGFVINIALCLLNWLLVKLGTPEQRNTEHRNSIIPEHAALKILNLSKLRKQITAECEVIAGKIIGNKTCFLRWPRAPYRFKSISVSSLLWFSINEKSTFHQTMKASQAQHKKYFM
jgi:hypothetical protein